MCFLIEGHSTIYSLAKRIEHETDQAITFSCQLAGSTEAKGAHWMVPWIWSDYTGDPTG